MQTICPLCWGRASHLVVKTDPELNLNVRAAGMTLPYRLHTRRCETCHCDFETVEIAKWWLDLLAGQTQRVAVLEQELAREQGKVGALRDQLQQIADVALSRPAQPLLA